jgi:hypothetical protein
MSDWFTAADGSQIPAETVKSRMDGLGWSRQKAEQTPVAGHTSPDREEVIAVRARNDKLSPAKVQHAMRTYGVEYEDARDYVAGLA